METKALNSDLVPEVEGFFHQASNTISYIVRCPASDGCAIVDSVLDFDFASGRTTYESADRLIDVIQTRRLRLEWIIETHVHADHLTAAPYIQQKLGGQTGVGEGIKKVQHTFGKIFNEGTEFQRDGSQFDVLFEDGDTYAVGKIPASVMATPGHTPACMVHVIGDAVFAGDTLFMPDGGSARADFPGGDAGQLYDSIQKILALPEKMRLFVCHDYGSDGRETAWETTIGEQRENNIHVGGGKTRDEFIQFRTDRDSRLSVPMLIIPSLQVNMRAGLFPRDDSGLPMFKVPVNRL